MYKLIIMGSVVLLAVMSTVSAKCDIMKEFKPNIDEISQWAMQKCAASSTLSDADIAKVKSCYAKNLQPLFTSASGQAINKFVQGKIFGNSNMKKVCTDKKVQDSVKKGAMKDIGMKKGMDAKKEMESDCPKYKSALVAMTNCCKS